LILARVPLPSGFFDVEIEKNKELRLCLHVEKTKIIFGAEVKLLIEGLRPKFYN
jgi:hypothetical protein